MTPLNHTISPNRRYALAVGDLSAVKRAGRAAGATVNDTLLALVAGMLGRYLATGQAPSPTGTEARPPVALVPVSVRGDPADGDTGNRISTVFVDLPVSEPDLAARIRSISVQTSRLKESAAVRAGA